MTIPNISIVGNKLAKKVLTKAQLSYLIWEEENNSLGPGGPSSTLKQKEVDEIINNLSDKTIETFCKWRWPDNIEEQFLIVLNYLAERKPKKGNVYASHNHGTGFTTKNLTFEEAQKISHRDVYVVPMEALSKIITS